MATLSYDVNCNMSNIQYPNHTHRFSGGSINRASTVKTAKVFRATACFFSVLRMVKPIFATETLFSPLSVIELDILIETPMNNIRPCNPVIDILMKHFF
jgi:hypothetical protein